MPNKINSTYMWRITRCAFWNWIQL